VNAAAGSITGLTSPATASYSSGSGTFTWRQDANEAASMDVGPTTIRKTTASSNGITIAPASAIAADYTLTLPAATPTLLAGNAFMQMSYTGVVSVNTSTDNASIEVGTGYIVGHPNQIRVKDGGISTAKLADDCVTQAKLGAVNATSATISATAQTYAYGTVELASMTLTTYGRPVVVEAMSSMTGGYQLVGTFLTNAATLAYTAYVYCIVDGAAYAALSGVNGLVQCGALRGQVSLSAGSHTFKVYAVVSNPLATLDITDTTVHVREI
jgi:hypothetical protein